MTEGIAPAGDPWKTLVAAVDRLLRAEAAEPHADADAEAEYASDLVALAARELVRHVERLDRRPVGWEDTDASSPVPQLPEGEYARVEIMGHDYHTGWVSDGERAGVKVMVIRDWDGRVLAEVPGQSLYRFVPLPTPLKRPDERAALPAAGGSDDYLWNEGPF
jgi:hypothetical protein